MTKTKVARTYSEIRQVGYDAGVENERGFCLRAIEIEAKEREALGLKEEAQALRFIAADIEAGRHIFTGEKRPRKTSERK